MRFDIVLLRGPCSSTILFILLFLFGYFRPQNYLLLSMIA